MLWQKSLLFVAPLPAAGKQSPVAFSALLGYTVEENDSIGLPPGKERAYV